LATYQNLTERFNSDAVMKKTSLSETFDFDAFIKMYGNETLPLFIITESGGLQVITADARPNPQPGQTLISVVFPVDEGDATDKPI